MGEKHWSTWNNFLGRKQRKDRWWKFGNFCREDIANSFPTEIEILEISVGKIMPIPSLQKIFWISHRKGKKLKYIEMQCIWGTCTGCKNFSSEIENILKDKSWKPQRKGDEIRKRNTGKFLHMLFRNDFYLYYRPQAPHLNGGRVAASYATSCTRSSRE